ncbi:MAG TPA: transglutaminase-like domain-containing protein, partial [Burkholderiaceae bacterium]
PDQMAGAFVVLMRAAGVPARLVTGYRGGRSMALTNYVVVKQSHAHAWPEVFIEGRGWTRYEPADLGAAAAAGAASAPAPAAAARPDAAAAAPEAGPASEDAAERALPMPDSGPGWMADLGQRLMDVLAQPLRWVTHFADAQQTDLLHALGLGGQGVLALLALTALTLGLLALAGWWLARRASRPRPDALARAWGELDARLRAIGLARNPAECPSRFMARVATLRPDLGAALGAAANIYLAGRYGAQPGAAQRLRKVARALPI